MPLWAILCHQETRGGQSGIRAMRSVSADVARILRVACTLSRCARLKDTGATMNDIDQKLDKLHYQMSMLHCHLKTKAYTEMERQQICLELTWCHQSALDLLQKQ